MLGGGLGYRHVYSDTIFGGYLLADYNRLPGNHYFWMGN